MDFWIIMKSLGAFFQSNLLIAGVLAVVVIFLLWWKPKLFFLILFILLLLAGILYIISSVSSTGVSHKERMFEEKGLPSMRLLWTIFSSVISG